MKKFVLLVVAIALVAAGAAHARSQATKIEIGATMAASEEVPAPKGDVASGGGTFTGTLTKSDTGMVLTWQLSFSNPSSPAPGSAPTCSRTQS